MLSDASSVLKEGSGHGLLTDCLAAQRKAKICGKPRIRVYFNVVCLPGGRGEARCGAGGAGGLGAAQSGAGWDGGLGSSLWRAAASRHNTREVYSIYSPCYILSRVAKDDMQYV